MIELLSCNEVSFLFFLFYFVFDFNLGGFVGIWYFSVFFWFVFFGRSWNLSSLLFNLWDLIPLLWI